MSVRARTRNIRFCVYIAIVSIAGLGALVAHVVSGPSWLSLLRQPAFHFVLVLSIAGELLPITVSRGEESEQITSSTAFVFAAFLAWSVWPAIVLMSVACLIDDMVARRAWWKRAFNTGQNALTFLAADAVLRASSQLLGTDPHGPMSARALPAIGAAALVFMVVNGALVLTAIAFAQRSAVFVNLRDGLTSQLMTTGVLLVLAPVVAVVIRGHGFLLPLLALPAFAVYQGGRATARIEHHARHDQLTDLPNRLALCEHISRGLSSGDCRAVVLVNLDGFRTINDTLGYEAGDLALVEVTQRLRSVAGDHALVARVAGDEFALAMPADEAAASASGRAVITALSEPLDVAGARIGIEASLGIALAEKGLSADAVLRRADVAMHVAKRLRTGLELYRREDDPASTRRLSLLGELRHAIQHDELVLHYQPKIDVPSGQVVGAEALVRWHHPERGFTPPDEFIPFAEQSGLIGPLSEWVLHTALREATSWRAMGYDLHVAVNVSVRNLYDRDFPARVLRALADVEFPADRLELEITEGTLMSDPGRALTVLRELNQLGLVLSLDDFGTGQSSLAQLQRLPVDVVKIDRSFVMQMLASRANQAIVRTIIDLAKNLDLVVVAEGVETPDALAALARMRCDLAQGYGISRPLAPDDFRNFLDRARPFTPKTAPATPREAEFST